MLKALSFTTSVAAAILGIPIFPRLYVCRALFVVNESKSCNGTCNLHEMALHVSRSLSVGNLQKGPFHLMEKDQFSYRW